MQWDLVTFYFSLICSPFLQSASNKLKQFQQFRSSYAFPEHPLLHSPPAIAAGVFSGLGTGLQVWGSLPPRVPRLFCVRRLHADFCSSTHSKQNWCNSQLQGAFVTTLFLKSLCWLLAKAGRECISVKSEVVLRSRPDRTGLCGRHM